MAEPTKIELLKRAADYIDGAIEKLATAAAIAEDANARSAIVAAIDIAVTQLTKVSLDLNATVTSTAE